MCCEGVGRTALVEKLLLLNGRLSLKESATDVLLEPRSKPHVLCNDVGGLTLGGENG